MYIYVYVYTARSRSKTSYSYKRVYHIQAGEDAQDVHPSVAGLFPQKSH